jgi:hypothetical protein
MSDQKSFKLVPASMLLDKETIGVINFHCGDGADGQFGEYSDGHLWVGTVTDDDGKEVYGLHLSTAEYPEEGSSTLIEFEAPEDDTKSQLAALREELAAIKDECIDHVNLYKAWTAERDDLRGRLADAERRDGVLAGYRWRNPLNSIYTERKEWCLVSISYGEVLIERRAQAIKSSRYAEDEFNSAYEIEPVYAALNPNSETASHE